MIIIQMGSLYKKNSESQQLKWKNVSQRAIFLINNVLNQHCMQLFLKWCGPSFSFQGLVIYQSFDLKYWELLLFSLGREDKAMNGLGLLINMSKMVYNICQIYSNLTPAAASKWSFINTKQEVSIIFCF